MYGECHGGTDYKNGNNYLPCSQDSEIASLTLSLSRSLPLMRYAGIILVCRVDSSLPAVSWDLHMGWLYARYYVASSQSACRRLPTKGGSKRSSRGFTVWKWMCGDLIGDKFTTLQLFRVSLAGFSLKRQPGNVDRQTNDCLGSW